eukprot:6488275-Amphidinium_carterae.2
MKALWGAVSVVTSKGTQQAAAMLAGQLDKRNRETYESFRQDGQQPSLDFEEKHMSQDYEFRVEGRL